MKKKIIIIIIAIIVIGVLCFAFFKIYKQKRDNAQIKLDSSIKITDDTMDISTEYSLYYKGKDYAESSKYNKSAASNLNSKLIENSSFLKGNTLDYSDIIEKNDNCKGNITVKNDSYLFSSSCKNDKNKIKVDYTLNLCEEPTYVEQGNYDIINDDSIIIYSDIDEEMDDEGTALSNNVYLIKLNSDGTKAWEKVFNDKLEHNDYSNFSGYSNTYLGSLSSENYDLIIFNYTNEYATEVEDSDETCDYFIIYKIDKKGKVLERKVSKESILYDYQINNNIFYYFANIYGNTYLKQIDINGKSTTVNSKELYDWYDLFYINNNKYYFLLDDDNQYVIKTIGSKNEDNQTIKISKSKNQIRGDCVDFFYYDNKYFIITDNTYDIDDESYENELILYIFDNNGEILKAELLLPRSKDFTSSYVGYNFNNKKINLIYYFTSNTDYSEYNHFYEAKYDSKDLTKTINDFYANYERGLYIGKKKYSVYVEGSSNPEKENNYFTVEINS